MDRNQTAIDRYVSVLGQDGRKVVFLSDPLHQPSAELRRLGPSRGTGSRLINQMIQNAARGHSNVTVVDLGRGYPAVTTRRRWSARYSQFDGRATSASSTQSSGGAERHAQADQQLVALGRRQSSSSGARAAVHIASRAADPVGESISATPRRLPGARRHRDRGRRVAQVLDARQHACAGAGGLDQRRDRVGGREQHPSVTRLARETIVPRPMPGR